MVQVCPNGGRAVGVPVTPADLAVAVRDAVAAGAADVHLHPRDGSGAETMEPAAVAAAVAAVRAAVPGVPVGVTTAAWVEADPERRAALIRSWSVLPDHASVNFHEDGAELVATALLERGVGIEAGIFSDTSGAGRFLAWEGAGRVLRVLAEVVDTDPRTAPDTAARLLGELGGAAGRPVLLHGEDGSAWPVLGLARKLGLLTRIGLEDTLLLPDEAAARDNAALVRAALRIG
jgi:uncharacterized protein (DUF849 family)